MKIAVFDFDGTLFNDETIPFLAKHWVRLGYSKRKFCIAFIKMLKIILKYKVKIDKSYGKEEFRRQATMIFLTLFDGMSKWEIQDFFNKCRQDVLSLINEDVVNEFVKRKEEGYYTILLSGCFSEMLYLIKDNYNFDKVISSSIIYKDNYIDSQVEIEIISGKNKVKHLALNLNLEDIKFDESYAYADSYYDRELLELFANPIAVNPDKILYEIARDKSWQIIRN